MGISGVSSLSSYYSSSAVSGRFSTTTTASTTEDEQGKVGKTDKPPQGQPPGPPPGEGTQIDSNSDNSWDSDELSSYAKYASSEYGVELDTESLLTEYDSDEDGILGESEIQSLMDNNGLQLQAPPPPPKTNSPDEQKGMMAQMSSTTSLSSSTLNILDYLSEDEEDEDEDEDDSTVSATSLDAATLNIEDFLSEDEDEEEDELSVTNTDQDVLKARQQEKMFEAYKQQTDYANYSDLESSLFFA